MAVFVTIGIYKAGSAETELTCLLYGRVPGAVAVTVIVWLGRIIDTIVVGITIYLAGDGVGADATVSRTGAARFASIVITGVVPAGGGRGSGGGRSRRATG